MLLFLLLLFPIVVLLYTGYCFSKWKEICALVNFNVLMVLPLHCSAREQTLTLFSEDGKTEINSNKMNLLQRLEKLNTGQTAWLDHVLIS